MLSEILNSIRANYNNIHLSELSIEMFFDQENLPDPLIFFDAYFVLTSKSRLVFRELIPNLASRDEFDNITKAVTFLKKSGLYNEVNVRKVASHAAPIHLVEALLCVYQANILTQENFSIIVGHTEPYSLASALSNLHQVEILTQENFSRLVRHEKKSFIFFFIALEWSKNYRILLTQDIFSMLADHADPRHLISAFLILQRARILTQENQAFIVAHASPSHLAGAFTILQRARILTPANRTSIAAHSDIRYLSLVFLKLQQARILTQSNFNSLRLPQHAQLLTTEAIENIWNRVPLHLLTQANFTRLLIASREAHAMQALQGVRDDILGNRLRVFFGQNINHHQSTHTASIHRSISESARRLQEIYRDTLNVDEIINQVKIYVNGLEGSLKNNAAKRCISRITSDDYIYEDRISGVSIRQLLAIAYRAIHDDERRNCILDDARQLLIDGLYEIQRGYNLNEQGIDNGDADMPICVAGTFNKIMEKLNGVHVEVNVVFITEATASIKFPIVAEQHAWAYLKTQASSQELIKVIEEEGTLEPIWENIKDAIATTLWDEFGEAYDNNRNNPRFNSLINSGIYLKAPDLSELKDQSPTTGLKNTYPT